MPSPQRFTLVSSVHLILVKDSRVLLLRRANTGYEDGSYSLVAGHLNGDEPATLAMCREASEEAGLKLDPKAMRLVHVMHRIKDDERIDFFFTTDTWSGEPSNTEPEKCDDLSWFPLDHLPTNIIPYIRQALTAFQQGVPYSEHGWKI